MLPRDVLRDLTQASREQWVLTDGDGGWAASTVIGLDTRREHGLLIAPQPVGPPILLLARVQEVVIEGSSSCGLATVEYPGTVEPDGFRRAVEFSLDPLPCLAWELPGGRLSRAVARLQGLPATVLAYTYEGSAGVLLELRPLVACRAASALQREGSGFTAVPVSGHEIAVTTEAATLRLAVRGGTWDVDGYWYRDHVRRADPGAPTEDLWSPGVVRVPLGPGGQVFLVAWTGELPGSFAPSVAMAAERKRLRALGEAPDGLLPELRRAAAAFLVRRPSGASILAALPGSQDPTAEAMVALPGLCLATGRHEKARPILAHHAQRVLAALRDGSTAPRSRTLADALWLALAAARFLEATDDRAFFGARLQETLFLAIESARETGHPGVLLSGDGLLFLDGAESGALVGTRPLPAARGPALAIEVQALWYNALLTAAEAAREGGMAPRGAEWAGLAARVRDSVLRIFWTETQYGLRDLVLREGEAGSERPGPAQLYAVGLPHALLPRDKAATLLEGVRRHLLTSRGLRGADGETVWPHLIGIYFDAVIRIWGEAGKAEAWAWMDGFAPHLGEGCIGQVSQAFTPEGLPSGEAAWAPAVGEVLRVLVRLGRRPGRGQGMR